MRKLLTLFVLSLVPNLITVPAFSISFKFDFYGGDTAYTKGVFEDPQEIQLLQSSTVLVDVYLVDWPTTVNFGAMDWYFYYNTASIEVVGDPTYNGTYFIPPNGSFDFTVKPGKVFIVESQQTTGVPGSTIELATITLQCKSAPSDDVIRAVTISVSDPFGGTDYTIDAGEGIIHQHPATISSTTIAETTTSISHGSSTTTITPITSTIPTTTTTIPSTTSTTIKDPYCLIKEIYGEHSEEVALLRYFRDNALGRTTEGQEIIKLYYNCSPFLVEAMEEDNEFKEAVKEIIDEILPSIKAAAE